MRLPCRVLLRAALVGGVALATVVSLLGPVAQAGEEQRLREVRAQIAQLRDQQAAESASLAEAEQQVAAVMAAVVAAEQAVERQRQAVEAARSKLAELEAEEEDRRRAMRARALSRYRSGSDLSLAVLFGAGTPSEAIRRTVLAEVVQRSDRKVIEGVEIAQVAIDAQREQLEVEEAALARVVEQERLLLAEVDAIRHERATVLAATSEELTKLTNHEQYLEAERQRVASISRRAGSGRPSRGGDSAGGVSASGWVWPANGPVTSEFGRRWGRIHEGIDIGGPTGSAIFAARTGTVTYTGRMGGYGLMTLVDHGGGIVTAYAHQSRIEVSSGQRVEAGQRIGSIGCTGSCTGPHLHFEVRVNGTARNPRNYLP
jgi:murein DD-endopeptidase MepM/ murein hydrolase activator NlpD